MIQIGGDKVTKSQKKNQEIALIKNEEEKTDKSYVSVACKLIPDSIHGLAILKELLEKVGIELFASHDESINMDILTFKINYETYNKMLSRKAGRKKDCCMESRYKPCTVSELKMKLKTMKNTEIIKELGCPKATFYRILKHIEGRRGIGDRSIWEFTSSRR